VYVSFIIEEDGAVSNVKTERAVDPILDKEAIRVVESMPKWTPGYQRGLAVRVKIILPVGFKLDDKK
jgi:protein TonB